MAITYDAPSDTITVTGYTEDTPCTFDDIYNEDQSQGWGQVSKQGDSQFCFDCALYIGDGVNETWFADTNKQIVWAVGGNNRFRVRAKGHARLGVLEDATEKSTSQGCAIISQVASTYFIRASSSDSELKLYSSLIIGLDTCGIRDLQGNNHQIYNCVIGPNAVIVDATVDLFNTILQNAGAESLSTVTGTFDRVTITNAGRAAIYARETLPMTVTNLYARNNPRLMSFTNRTVPVYLIDIDTDVWTFNWWGTCTDKAYRQYKFNLHVVDSAGANVSSATVTLKDKDGNQVFQVSTAADGTITEQTVSRGYYDQAHGNVLQDYGSFKLQIAKTGYMPYVHENIILNEPVDWRIYLRTQLSGNASVLDVSSGKTFYADDADTRLTGLGSFVTDILPFTVKVEDTSLDVEIPSHELEVVIK